jgi:FeS assembly protein IscX
MQLSWSDRDRIAEALAEAHPETDRLALSLDDVKDLVRALPGFAGPPEPPRKAHLESILWTWMRLADEGES